MKTRRVELLAILLGMAWAFGWAMMPRGDQRGNLDAVVYWMLITVVLLAAQAILGKMQYEAVEDEGEPRRKSSGDLAIGVIVATSAGIIVWYGDRALLWVVPVFTFCAYHLGLWRGSGQTGNDAVPAQAQSLEPKA